MSQQGDAIYFDGQSNRKRKVQIHLGPALEIVEDERPVANWPYGDVRRVDAAPGSFRLMCIGAPGLARLEIYDEATRQAIESRCAALTSGAAPQTLRIIAYSVAALASFLGLLFYGVPLLADRLTMVVPPGWKSASAKPSTSAFDVWWATSLPRSNRAGRAGAAG